MANRKLTQLGAQTAANLALADLLLTHDLSDTTDDASGTVKKIEIDDLLCGARLALAAQSVSAQGPGFSADTYLTGSRIVFPTNYPIVGTTYRCIFDVTKTAAGTATPIVNLRFGTAGTTADTAICTFTFGAGSAAVDAGMFELIATFRTVGSGTSAVVQGMCRISNALASTGITNATKFRIATSSGFNSTTASAGLGISYNAGTSAAHTIQLVRSELIL